MKTILSLFTAALLVTGCAGPNSQMETPDEQASEEVAECPEGTVAVEDADENAPLAERCIAEAETEQTNEVATDSPTQTEAELETSVDAAEGRIEPGPSTPGEPEDGGDPVPPKGPQD